MLDISSAVRALHSVKEIHVIAVMGEVKELLFLLKKYHLRPILIHTVNILKNTTQYFSFRDNEQADSQYNNPQKIPLRTQCCDIKSRRISSHFQAIKSV